MKKKIIIVVFSLLLAFSIYKISSYYIKINSNNKANEKLVKDVVKIEKVIIDEEEVEIVTIDYDTLLGINKDVKAWIRFNHEKINYPVVQTNNNDYYLNHDFYKKSTFLGAIFMDYRNDYPNDKNTILYGHNITDGSMFGSLREALKSGFFDDSDNRIIEIIDIKNNVYHYEIFSIYTIVKEEYYLTTGFENDDAYLEFLNTLKSRSNIDFGISLDETDNILTLSTCDGVGATNNRLVIHAKLIKK